MNETNLTVKVTLRIVKTMITNKGSAFKGYTLESLTNMVADMVVEQTGGATVQPATVGSWKDATGMIIREHGQDIVTYTDPSNLEALKTIAIWTRDLGKQDCVIFTVEIPQQVAFL